MELGNVQRIYTVEPIEDPVPASVAAEADGGAREEQPEVAEEPATRP